MFTRAGCHLCDEAWQILESARQQYGFTLQAVDVDIDPELIDGKVRFRGRINSVLLSRLLRAEKWMDKENS